MSNTKPREAVGPPPIGRKYGEWTVVGEGPPSPGSSMTRWAVQCSCGDTHYVRAVLLRKGESCKCHKCRDSGKYIMRHDNANWRGYGKIGRTEYTIMVRRAKEKGMEMNVSIEYLSKILEQQNSKCALTGLPLIVHTGKGSASIDRIDSSQGYIEGNVQWVDKRVNIMKNRLPEAEFVELCRLVFLKQEKKNGD